jgi:NAD+ diphosphatase
VGFLRPDHTFLTSALHHPSTTFLLFNKLEPLVQSGTEIARCTFSDVKPVIGNNPFEKSEQDVIAQYNSTLYIPQIIFLGLDERKKGEEDFVYKEHYKGQPWFAVDVTPKEGVAEAAEQLIERLKGDGLEFSKGRMHLSLPAEEGTSPPPLYSHIQLSRGSRH